MSHDSAPSLSQYFAGLSDEGLLAEASAGREAFEPAAWDLLKQEINLRALNSRRNRRKRLGYQYDPTRSNRQGMTVGMRWAAFPALCAGAWTIRVLMEHPVRRALPLWPIVIAGMTLFGIAIPIDLIYEARLKRRRAALPEQTNPRAPAP